MKNNSYQLLNKEMGIHNKVLDIISAAEEQVTDIYEELDDIMTFNQYKVLDVFQNAESRICTLAGILVTDMMILVGKP